MLLWTSVYQIYFSQEVKTEWGFRGHDVQSLPICQCFAFALLAKRKKNLWNKLAAWRIEIINAALVKFNIFFFHVYEIGPFSEAKIKKFSSLKKSKFLKMKKKKGSWQPEVKYFPYSCHKWWYRNTGSKVEPIHSQGSQPSRLCPKILEGLEITF